MGLWVAREVSWAWSVEVVVRRVKEGRCLGGWPGWGCWCGLGLGLWGLGVRVVGVGPGEVGSGREEVVDVFLITLWGVWGEGVLDEVLQAF